MGFREETISSELLYDGKILKLRKDKVTTVSGKTSYREIIEHDGGAVAVAITDDNNILLVKQFRKAMEDDIIELPAGKIEKDEDPLDTMARELEEETGYKAENIKLIGKFHPSVGYTSETLYIYLAENLKKGEVNFDSDEDIELIKVPFDKAVKMVVDGTITDGKTMAGILLAKYHI